MVKIFSSGMESIVITDGLTRGQAERIAGIISEALEEERQESRFVMSGVGSKNMIPCGQFEGLYYNRGVCALLGEQWEAAAADFGKSIETEPYVDDARYNLAICQMQQEQYDTAVATFTELIGDGEGAEKAEGEEEKTVNDGAYYYRAVCNAALGKLEEAKADYTTCIDHGYELAQSYYQRAQVNAALGDTEGQNADLQASLSAAE